MKTIYDLEKARCNKFINVVASCVLSITFALLALFLLFFSKEEYVFIGIYGLIALIYAALAFIKPKPNLHMHIVFVLGSAGTIVAAITSNIGDIAIPVIVTFACLFYVSKIPVLYSTVSNFFAMGVVCLKNISFGKFDTREIFFLAGIVILTAFVIWLRRFVCKFLLNKFDEYERMYFCSQHDPLTGLPNRLLFLDRLNQAISEASRTGKFLAVIFLDLDSFKKINDTAGHLTGDRLLVEVGQRILNVLRDNDTLARLGGDEFVVLLPYMDSPEDAAIVEERIRNAFLPPFYVKGDSYHISSGIGKAIYPLDGKTAESLIQQADLYMLKTKKKIPV